jgi:hypothetical protein
MNLTKKLMIYWVLIFKRGLTKWEKLNLTDNQ